jgi:hypothetical protein
VVAIKLMARCLPVMAVMDHLECLCDGQEGGKRSPFRVAKQLGAFLQ